MNTDVAATVGEHNWRLTSRSSGSGLYILDRRVMLVHYGLVGVLMLALRHDAIVDLVVARNVHHGACRKDPEVGGWISAPKLYIGTSVEGPRFCPHEFVPGVADSYLLPSARTFMEYYGHSVCFAGQY